MENLLLQLFIFLASATIAVPIAKKFGLGSVLGYLMAGFIIGPYGLSLIGDIEKVMHFTEFGVVMMLFLVGLELKPSLLWQMRVPILGMGGLQIILSSIIISGVAFIFLPWQQAIAIGLVLSLSSTAIVMQTLREKELMNTPSGRSIFSVLLCQDLAVIPMLAILPYLATIPVQNQGVNELAHFNIKSLPGHLQIIVSLIAILFIFFLGRFASRPMFRIIAATRIREIFVGATLALVVGISLLMTAVGLSPALGVFLAGVVLADSEYQHELISDIEPFKGLLLGVFFISIGASLNFTLIREKIFMIAGLAIALIVFKWLVLFITGKIFKIPRRERFLFSCALAQGGEFAFVLFQFSKVNGVLSIQVIDPLISAVSISMFLTPLFFLAYDMFCQSGKCDEKGVGDADNADNADSVDSKGHRVILAGFGRLGTDLGRFLISAGIQPIIFDHDAANVDILRRFGFEVYYGDITRLDLLEAAGASDAELLVITINDIDRSRELVKLVSKHYPHLKIIVNAYDHSAAYELMDLGVTNIRRETFGCALSIGQDALEILGFDPYKAQRLMHIFRKNDEAMMPVLYKTHREDKDRYISMYQQHNIDLEELMKVNVSSDFEELYKAWNAEEVEALAVSATSEDP